jgi:hypothetical protein
MTSTVQVEAIWLLCAVLVDLTDAIAQRAAALGLIAYELVHMAEIRDHLRG